MSYITDLSCYDCGQSYDASKVQTFCPDCQAPLIVNYDLDAARKKLDRDEFRSRPAGMWRWRELLPLHETENMIYLGEGDTPLLNLPNLGSSLGLSQLYVKDESINPTGTFKARGLAAAVSKAKELGVTKVIIPTAGNAGGAMAAYAARGGLEAYIFMPRDTPEAARPVVRPLARLGAHLGVILEVVAGAERPVPGARHDRNPQIRVLLELVEDLAHLLRHRRMARIHHVRPVHRDDHQVVVDIDFHEFWHRQAPWLDIHCRRAKANAARLVHLLPPFPR